MLHYDGYGAVTSQEEISGFNPPFCVDSASSHCVRVSKDKQSRSNGNSKLLVSVNVSVNGCVSLGFSPVMSWRPVRWFVLARPISAGIDSSSLDPAGGYRF